MKNQINATQMKQGDVISFYGAEFTLGEVFKSKCHDDDTYYAKGICTKLSAQILNNNYFYNAITGEYSWTFQGNKLATLIKVN
jgi:hypothetical protein